MLWDDILYIVNQQQLYYYYIYCIKWEDIWFLRFSETMNNMRIESESLESEMILDLEREENAGNIESLQCV